MTNLKDIALSGTNQIPVMMSPHMCDFKMLPSQKQNRKVKGVLMVYGKEQGTNFELHNKFWKSNMQYRICS